jgi:uncharacterized membrane protein YsdA (DUF1294 family)
MLYWYLLIINLFAFTCYGIDKLKAKRSAQRISERSLLLLAVAGGSIGAWLGMLVWRHKTKQATFRYGLPAILVLQVAACLWWLLF